MSSIPMPNRNPWGKWVGAFGRLKPGEYIDVDTNGLRGLRIVSQRYYGRGAMRQKSLGLGKFRVWRVK